MGIVPPKIPKILRIIEFNEYTDTEVCEYCSTIKLQNKICKNCGSK